MGFLAGNYKICHGFGRVWVIEGSMSDSRWWRNQETAELDVTSTSFPKLISKSSRCTDCFHGQLRLFLVSFVQNKLWRRTSVMKYFLLLPNGILRALLRPSETLCLIPPLCFQYSGFFCMLFQALEFHFA